MSATRLEHARRYARIGLALLGVLFTLIYIQRTQAVYWRGWGRPPPAPRSFELGVGILSDGLTLAVGLISALLVCLVLLVLALRAPKNTSPRPSWWRTLRAHFLAVSLFALGAGFLSGWMLEWAGDEAAALCSFLLAIVLTATLTAFEQGKAPALSLLLAAFLCTVAIFGRTLWGARPMEYLWAEIVISGFFYMLLLPPSYLLFKGMLTLVSKQGEEGGSSSHLGVLPLEILAHEGTYLVQVEAPGLEDTSEVEVGVDGCSLHLTVPRPLDRPEGLLHSTRFTGRFQLEVTLPRPLQDPPWEVGVAHGLLRVQVAPIAAD